MTMRIHEIHPSLVHFPLTLIPVSLLLDLVGRLTGKRSWMRAGARMMPVAAASGALAATAGLVAQGAVEVDRGALETLVTHRNLNLGLVALTGVLALVRARSETPSIVYLAAGVAGMVAMNYTAYLGARLVYRHGVGVEKAGGVRPERSPEVRWENIRDVLGVTADSGREALRHTARDLGDAEIAPALHRPDRL